MKRMGILVLLFTINSSLAAEYRKDGAFIEMIDRTAERPKNPAYSNNIFVKLSTVPKWSGGDCMDDWVALQKNDSIGFGIALAALTSGNQVLVRVDDSLPKIGGTHCQVTTIAIKNQNL
ncbi:MAG: hypothetical protein ACFHVJ_13840 [Aestuariibacter sp.]